MLIGGLQKFSLIDYPGKISAVVFLLGCNFRCGFCHNPELAVPELADWKSQVSAKEVLEFLAGRKGKLDGVCITGGEPTLWQELPKFIKEIKKLGFLVKLDTNATNPKMVKSLLGSGLVDYFAIDIKNSPGKYGATVNAKAEMENIEEALKTIAAKKTVLELRTTVVPGLIAKEDFVKIKEWLEGLGVLPEISLYAIQQFRPLKTLDEKFQNIKPYSEKELKEMAKIFKDKIKIEIRGV